MDELEALRRLTIEKRLSMGLNEDGTRPAGVNPVAAVVGAQSPVVQLMRPQASGFSTGTDTAERTPWTCSECGTHYAGTELDVPGLGRRLLIPRVGQCHECESRAHKRMLEEQKRRENSQTVELFLKWSDIGAEYRESTFDNYQLRPGTHAAFREAKHFVDTFEDGSGRWLLLYGSPGNGKTRLGMAIRGEIERRYVCQALAVTQPFLMNKIRASWSRRAGEGTDERSEEWMLDRLRRARFVLWDDLMDWQDWAEDRMFDLLDSRCRNNRKMVFTSNHSAEELKSILGSRLWSRFASRVVMVPVTAGDYRIEVERRRIVGEA